MTKMTAIFLIAIGSIFIIAGTVIYSKAPNSKKIPDTSRMESAVDTAIADGVLTKNERDTIRKIAVEVAIDPDKAITDAEGKMATLNIKAETAIIDQNKKSGDDFEKFVVQKFDKKYFNIENWAGDKYVDGRYAKSTPQPDLLIEFKLKGESYPFAVECKWRKNHKKDGFEFASEAQLERYRKFEAEKQIPVFVAIGLGGEGADPEHLYIIPLKRLKYNFITLDYLEQFKKNKEKKFFFDKETRILR